MNFQFFNLSPTFSVAIAVQPSQTKSTNQSNYDFGYLGGLFITSMMIGMILGCFLRYRKRKNQRNRQTVEIIRSIENLDKVPKTTNQNQVELHMTTQRKKQIETLEKIWKNNS
jgi:predicted histidine transporter YuiF (NhaC family)